MSKAEIIKAKANGILQFARRHKWQVIGGLILFFTVKVLWWDNVQFIGPIPPKDNRKLSSYPVASARFGERFTA